MRIIVRLSHNGAGEGASTTRTGTIAMASPSSARRQLRSVSVDSPSSDAIIAQPGPSPWRAAGASEDT